MEQCNRKIRFTESINNKVSEDKDFEKWFDKEYAKMQKDLGKSVFKNIHGIEPKPIKTAISRQDNRYTYTYVEDNKTAEEVFREMINFFKEKGASVGDVTLDVDVKKIIKDVDSYGPLYDMKGKFLSNGYFTAHFNDNVNKSSKGKIVINAALNSIKIDMPQFKDFSSNDDKFILFIESNGYRVKNVNQETFSKMIDDLFDRITPKLTDNWKLKTNIKTNTEIDYEG